MAHPSTTAEAIAPLAGYTIAVAGDRRRDRLADLLESVGARTVCVQAARSVAKPASTTLQAATARLLSSQVDDVVISSAVGLRAWVAAARRESDAGALIARFSAARLLARDPAAADALRTLGLRDIYSTDANTTEDLLRYLLAQPLAGRRIAVQTNRLALSEVCATLRERGADVIEVPTFVVAAPAENYSLRRLCDLVIRRQVDALALLGTPVDAHLHAQAVREHRLEQLREALRTDVLCVALGSAPASRPILPATLGPQPFIEELAETVLQALPQRGVRLRLPGHLLEVRGQAVVLDGQLIPLPGGPLAVLRALARHPGKVLSATEIRDTVPEWSDVDDHAVEMAVSRLRRLLRDADLIQTIVNRGYRLAV